MRHVILNLHGLGDPGRELPDPAEIQYWVMPELLTAALHQAERLSDQVRTSFTFDDGNRSDLTIGADLIETFGHRATFFVLSSRIDASGYLTASDLRALVARGHQIGSHGVDHVPWTGLDPARLKHELVESRRKIGTAADITVTKAALPLGRYDSRVLRALHEAGYDAVYSSDGGSIRTSRWPIPRTSLTRSMTETDITNILLGREPFRRKMRRVVARAVKSWL